MILAKRPVIKWKTTGKILGKHMGKLIRALFFLIVLLAIGLVGFAYLGPIFGADFSAPQTEIRESVPLDVQ